MQVFWHEKRVGMLFEIFNANGGMTVHYEI
jgi:hypothetical protein